MKKLKKILLGMLITAIAGTGYGFYLFNKKPADVRKLTANYELTAATIVAEFNADETAANARYLDKVISTKGIVADVKVDTTGQATVFLDSGDPMAMVTCSFYSEEAVSAKNLQKGTEVTIKGKCTGKLMDVVLNKCSITQ
ncbi:hypothetical protein BH11BAC4_BH11BAC4_05920 [soil metagenome]